MSAAQQFAGYQRDVAGHLLDAAEALFKAVQLLRANGRGDLANIFFREADAHIDEANALMREVGDAR